MRNREDILREIGIFARGANGYSPLIMDILRNIERDFGGVEEYYISEIAKAFKVEEVEVLDSLKMLGIKLLKSIEAVEVRVCLGQTCSMRGSEAILDKYRKLLGVEVDETTEDGRIKLSVQRCFGRCPMGPNVRIGDEIISEYSLDRVEEDIKRIRG